MSSRLRCRRPSETQCLQKPPSPNSTTAAFRDGDRVRTADSTSPNPSRQAETTRKTGLLIGTCARRQNTPRSTRRIGKSSNACSATRETKLRSRSGSRSAFRTAPFGTASETRATGNHRRLRSDHQLRERQLSTRDPPHVYVPNHQPTGTSERDAPDRRGDRSTGVDDRAREHRGTAVAPKHDDVTRIAQTLDTLGHQVESEELLQHTTFDRSITLGANPWPTTRASRMRTTNCPERVASFGF